MKENAIDFHTDLLCKYDFLVEVFIGTNQANYRKTTREFITEVHVGIALAEVILELLGSFTLEWRLVIYLAETLSKLE